MSRCRREIVKHGLGGLLVGVMGSMSGCVELDNNKDTDDGGNNRREDESTSLPNPVIESSGYPRVKSFGTSKQRVDAGYKYKADIFNTGSSGDVNVGLYVIPKDTNKTVLEEKGVSSVEGAEKVNQERISVSFEEDTTYEVVADAGKGKGYWFVYRPVTASVTIRNTGSTGDVRVTFGGGEKQQFTDEITMKKGEVTTVSFEPKGEMKNVSVSARPVESDGVTITN